MEKKLLTGAIASAVALASAPPADAKPQNARQGLDNPLDDVSCDFNEDGFWAYWTDPNTAEHADEDPTKYGGDVEFDAWLMSHCDFEETIAEGLVDGFWVEESAIVDIDLSKDAEEPFHYTCAEAAEDGSVDCAGHLDWDGISEAADEAAEDALGWHGYYCMATMECTEADLICEDGSIEINEECLVCDGDVVVGNECWVCDEGVGEGGECLYGDGITIDFDPGDGYFECSEYEAVRSYAWDAEDGYFFSQGDGCSETVLDGEFCTVVDGNFHTEGEVHEHADFSVKEMNPGNKTSHGNRTRGAGRQNWEKAYTECSFPSD